jgi:hypothetical protein
MRKIVGLFLFLVAVPLLAADKIQIRPLGPTSDDAITLRIPIYCSSETPVVTRVDNVIKIQLQLGYFCDPPILNWQIVKLAPLPSGSYRVEAFDRDTDQVYADASFVVRKAAPIALELHPNALRTSVQPPTRVRLTRVDGSPICSTVSCEGQSVRVGAALVTLAGASDGAAWFTPPARTQPGFVDVQLTSGETSIIETNALYYFNEPDPSVFERVLFPVLLDAPGVNGSHWISETVIANSNRWWVENWNYVQPFVCIDFPCIERLQPGTYDRFLGNGYAHGIALLVPRDEVDNLAFSLRIRDTSRAAEGFGTSLPVVREKEMFHERGMTLLDVPRDTRYRVKLRIYALPPFPYQDGSFADVRIVDPETKAQTSQIVPMTAATATAPAYGELDLPAGAEAQRSAIYVHGPDGSYAWAFATVTNNVTQQVTIVTPGGSGDVPCAGCVEP